MNKPFIFLKDALAAALMCAALAIPGRAQAQAVIFPQEKQPGAAQIAEGATAGSLVLSNQLLSATFINHDGKLSFGGCEELGLLPGTELFTVTLGDGTAVAASDMTLKSWKSETLAGDPTATVASEKIPGQAIVANLNYGDLNFEWKAVLRDGSHYLRTELVLTANKDVEMHNVVPMIYEMNKADTPEVVGNTRGAVLASSSIFAGLETPTGLNTVENPEGTVVTNSFGADDGFSLTSWKADTSGDTQPANPAYWAWVPGAETPAGIRNLGFTADVVRGKRGFAKFSQSGTHTVTFKYQSGSHGLNIIGVDVVNADGEVIAYDYHIGFTGGRTSNNVFTLNLPEAGTYLVRYFVEIRTETITSTGTVTWQPSVSAASAPAGAGNGNGGTTETPDTKVIKGTWSRHTTLAAGKTWKVSAVVGIIAPGQARRSFLAYSERERAVPWRCFPHYNSWYELNIDRNNSATYDGHMTAQDCVNVVNIWKDKLFDAYGVGIKAFVWDDGWDEYGTWGFNKGFPNGFKEPYDVARQFGAGMGAWLGPVGGYGTSGNLRRQYWTNKGGMQLSNPAYYKVFLDACSDMVEKYDFCFFKLDGISAQFSSVGPDAGYTGEENAEGIIDVLSAVREIRPDMFFNTTVGTWASPFWFHYSDAVWRQEADWNTIGNQGDDRERWITYRDRLVYQNFVQNSPLCPINTLMTHGVIVTKNGAVSKTMTYEGILRELRCGFACGSGMVELYCDSEILNSVNGGALWADIADCIKWQQANADVLPDTHWVGGNPWDGSKANVYGWASWNGKKATLALRNPATATATYSFTLREALEIPDYDTTPIYLYNSFSDQADLIGLTTDAAISPDTRITVTLPGSSVYVFDGSITARETEPGKEEYTVMVTAGDHGTVRLLNGDTQVFSGRKVAANTVLTIEATPDYGYLVESITVNGDALEGLTITVTEPTNVEVTFSRDPEIPVIYGEPSGNTRAETYVEQITSADAEANISVAYDALPAQVYNLLDQTIKATPGQTFTVNLKAHSLGEGSSSTVYQDLRYATAYVFVDWYGEADFTLDAGYGNLPPTHNVYGNYDEVMNLTHTFTMPADLADGAYGRLRILYSNAWGVPGTNGSLGANGHTVYDCDPNSQYVVDGVCYDIPVVAVNPADITDAEAATDSADTQIYTIQGIRVNAATAPGVYIIVRNGHATKTLVK